MTDATAQLDGKTVIINFGENTNVAAAAALRAESAAIAAQAAAGLDKYADTSAGLAGTTEGEFFWVDNGAGIGIVYRHDAGPVATEIRRFIIDPEGTSAASLIGADDGASGTLWTKVQGFIDYVMSSLGASIVGFLQSGADTTPTTLQAEGRATIRPEQFAGTTAQKINRAIIEANARGGGVVELGSGTYSIDEPILMLSDVTLQGKGRGATIIAQTGTASAWAAFTTSSGIVTTITADEFTNIHVRDLDVQGIYSTPIADGAGPPYAKNGISIGKTQGSSVERCGTYDTGTGIILFGNVAGVTGHRNLIRECYANNARSWNAAGNTGAPRGITIDGDWSDVEYCVTDDCYTGFYASSEHGTFTGCFTQLSTDDGFYINANYVSLIACKGKAAATRAAGSGSCIAVNPAHGCRIIACEAINYPNSGIRLRHDGALAPYDNVIADCHFEDCGYGILSDLTGASAWPTGIAAFNNKITGNTAYLCQNNGFNLSRFANGVIADNTALNNNQAGVSIGTRGGIGLLEYCTNNVVVDNICNDTQGSPTQTFGLYSYPASVSGAGSENTGNRIRHRSISGIDLYFPSLQRGQVSASVTSGNRAGIGSITFPLIFEGVPRVKLWMQDATATGMPDGEFPFSVAARSPSTTGANYRIDLFANAAANRTIVLEWEATYGDLPY